MKQDVGEYGPRWRRIGDKMEENRKQEGGE